MRILRLGLVAAVSTVLFTGTLAAAGAAENAPSAGDPIVDAAVQVTDDPAAARAHATPAVAVDPTDPRRVALIEGDAYNGGCQVHVSTNAGLSWTTSPLTTPAPGRTCVYANFGPIADIAFGGDGRLYAVAAAHDPATYESRLFLHRSDDGGATWREQQLPWLERDTDAGQLGIDALPSVAVDPADPERVAVGWMSNNGAWNLSEAVLGGREYPSEVFPRAYLTLSTDGGETFSAPLDLGGDDVDGYLTEPSVLFDGNGAVHAFFGDYRQAPEDDDSVKAEPSHVYHAVSADGTAVRTAIVSTQESPQDDSNWLSGVVGGAAPGGGSLYVVWEEMGDQAPSVRFATSSDGGASWGAPVTLNDAEPARQWLFNEFLPALAVAPGGRIDVAWYDWRDDPTFDPEAEETANAFQRVYATSSTDGGTTWSANRPVDDRMIDRRKGVWQSYGVAGAVGLAATDDATYVAWDDTRNAGGAESQDVYFTRMRYTDSAAIFSGGDQPDGLVWLGVGFAAALALSGLVLLGVSRGQRRPVKATG